MWKLHALLLQKIFHFAEFAIHLCYFFHQPLYFHPRCLCTFYKPDAGLRILQYVRSPAVAASAQLCVMPDLADPRLSQLNTFLTGRVDKGDHSPLSTRPINYIIIQPCCLTYSKNSDVLDQYLIPQFSKFHSSI